MRRSALQHWRSPALALAAVAFWMAGAVAQETALAERIRLCGSCHGEDGNSRIENIPSLAGQPAFFILNQLFLMREGVRRIDVMTPLVKDLKDEDIDALARHFAGLAPKPAQEPAQEPVDPLLARRGAELAISLRCASCHLPSLAGQDQMPRLAKQRVDYLIHAMKAFRDNTRSGADTLMSNVVAALSDADIAALAHYAASR